MVSSHYDDQGPSGNGLLSGLICASGSRYDQLVEHVQQRKMLLKFYSKTVEQLNDNLYSVEHLLGLVSVEVMVGRSRQSSNYDDREKRSCTPESTKRFLSGFSTVLSQR